MDEETNLYNWMKEQKENYHLGLLNKEQIKKLESLPDWSWD